MPCTNLREGGNKLFPSPCKVGAQCNDLVAVCFVPLPRWLRGCPSPGVGAQQTPTLSSPRPQPGQSQELRQSRGFARRCLCADADACSQSYVLFPTPATSAEVGGRGVLPAPVQTEPRDTAPRTGSCLNTKHLPRCFAELAEPPKALCPAPAAPVPTSQPRAAFC